MTVDSVRAGMASAKNNGVEQNNRRGILTGPIFLMRSGEPMKRIAFLRESDFRTSYKPNQCVYGYPATLCISAAARGKGKSQVSLEAVPICLGGD